MTSEQCRRFAKDWDEDADGGMHFIGMYEHQDGDWVRYDDHAAALAARDQRVVELEQNFGMLQLEHESRVRELEATVSAHERHGACAEREVSEALRQLAAANALLEYIATEASDTAIGEATMRRIRLHLSKQPAAPGHDGKPEMFGYIRCWS